MSDALYNMCFDRHLNRYKDANGNVITADEWARGVCKPKKTNNKKIKSFSHRLRHRLRVVLKKKKEKPLLRIYSPKKTVDDPEMHPFSLPLS